MTHDEIIAVVTAHRDGKKIEHRNRDSTEWLPTESPAWNFRFYDYRIKSEPREFWIVKHLAGYAVCTEDVTGYASGEVIHVREAME